MPTMLTDLPGYKARESYRTAIDLIKMLRDPKSDWAFLATKQQVPFTDVKLMEEMWDGVLKSGTINTASSICVFYTVEMAILLASKGYQNITVVTSDWDENVKDCLAEFDEFSHIKYHILSEVNKNMKFDVVVGNPPYQNGSDKKFYQKFIDKAESLSSIVALVVPSTYFSKAELINDLAVYRPLGAYFKGAQLVVSYFVKDKSRLGGVTLIDSYGVAYHETDRVVVSPGSSVADYKIAKKIVEKNDQGVKAKSGKLPRNRAKRVGKPGIKCVFTAGKVNGDFDWAYIDSSQESEVFGLGEHKVICSSNGALYKFGALKYLGPEAAVGLASAAIVVGSEDEALNLIAYLQSRAITFLVKSLKSTSHWNSGSVFKSIPAIDLSRSWTDDELYQHFGLTQEEIDAIERSN